MKPPTRPNASALRRIHLRDALGNAALEGIRPKPETLADLRAVAEGTLTPDEYRRRVKARHGIAESV